MFQIVEDPMPPLPENCDALLEDFLNNCFNKNPGLRPSAEELSEHPWLKKNWSAFKVPPNIKTTLHYPHTLCLNRT